MYIHAAISIPVENRFSYAVPAELEKEIALGKRVLLPFGKKKMTGYIVSILSEADREEIKPISAVLDQEPLFNADDLRFFQWASDYYLYPLGKVLKDVLPGGIDTGSNYWIRLADPVPVRKDKPSPLENDLIGFLHTHSEGVQLTKLKEAFTGRRIDSPIKKLLDAGWIVQEEQLKKPLVSPKRARYIHLNSPCAAHSSGGGDPTPSQRRLLDYLELKGETPALLVNAEFKNAAAMMRALQKKGWITILEKEVLRNPETTGIAGGSQRGLKLNSEQESACKALFSAIDSGRFSTHLLHGVTGSGKTEVYFQAIEKVLAMGGSVIYLVPEIALTPQLLGRVSGRFSGKEIAVMHSGVSMAVRYDQWRRICRGEIRIIVGARSAVFAPARNLRLIIVDEEHDGSYKQDERMRYHARDLAIIRAQQLSAVVVLGSATPSLHTYHHALNGKHHLLRLSRRVEDKPLPAVHVIDMKTEMDPDGKARLLSRPLLAGVQETLDQGKQVMLFLNRRGFHTFVCCYTCGHVFKCLNCSVSLTHHVQEGVLRCHYCGFSLKALPLCPVCGEGRIGTYGMGTEKLEKEAAERFPGASIERMDSDTTSARGAHERILRRFSEGKIDILIGTQMIAKGHDYPNVLLVGIISADTALNLPDFRAAEKTFQLITQVSGRSGRGDDPGRVFIQTFNPDHDAIRFASCHDYRGFYEKDLSIRRDLAYPPFSRMVSILISSNVQDRAARGAQEIGKLARSLAAGTRIEILGPAEAPIPRIKGKHRWHLLLKGNGIQTLHRLARRILQMNSCRDVTIKVDVDPVNFM